MKNKFLIVFSIVILAYLNSFSQAKMSLTDTKFKEHKEAGDKYFNDDEFYLAAMEYHKAEKLKSTDHYVLWRLAESYRKYQDYDDAEVWYAKLCATPDNSYPLALFQLGLMQKTNSKYIDAENTLSSFIKNFKPITEEDKLELKEAEFEYKGCVYALDLLRKPVKQNNFKLLPAPLNSKSVDYAPMIFFHDSSIVITSQRSDAKGSEMNLATGEARSDNFRFEKTGNKWLRHHNDDNFDIVNTPKDDGAGELTHDHSKYYYTICDPECDIFVSKKVAGKFTKPLKLNKNINIPNYWNAQPTVSPTADTMFFVSKRPNGKAIQPNKQYDHDIWMSINKDKTGATEDWGTAVNLTNINTPYIEIAPFWDDHTNTIYFASNGHVGFGGWDIYQAKGKNRDSIVNLGMPFNSARDDFYFTLGKEKGYLVSNRVGGIGKDDIYSFDINVKESTIGDIPKDSFANAESVSSVGRIILNDSQQPVADLPVFLKDENGNTVREGRTNNNGEFKFENLPPDKNYKITMNENDPRLKTNVNYEVQKKAPLIPNVDASGVVTDKTTKKPLANVPIEIKDASGVVVQKTTTDATGKYVAKDLPGGIVYKTAVASGSPMATKSVVNAKYSPQVAIAKPSSNTNLSVATGTNSLNSSTQNTANIATEKSNPTVATGTNSLNSSTQNTANIGTEKANSDVATGTNSLNSSTQNTANVATEKVNSTIANGTNSLNSSTQNTANAGTEKSNTTVATGTNSLNSSTQNTTNVATEKANTAVATGTNSLNSSTQNTTNVATEKANTAVATGTSSLNSSTQNTANVATEKANTAVATGTNSLNSSTQNTTNIGTEKANSAVSTGTNSLNSSTQNTTNVGTEKSNSTVASGTNSLNSSTQSTANAGTEKANAAVASGTNSLNSSAGTTSNRIKSIETNNVITETESTITETKTPEKVIVSENIAEQTMASEVKTPKSATKKAVSFSELPSEQPEAQNSVSNGTKSRFSIDNFKISSSAIKPSRTFFENVYFDFNSADLTAISKKAMDQLVQYYGENKEIQIDIKAYSDGFGDPAYNKNLAEQRGKACYDYFLAQGVDQTALVVTPAGENNPVANNNSFAGRQLNRRVEFAIIGSKTAFQPEAMAHVLEPRMTLFSVAKKYGMTMQELRNWNGGINAEDIKAYSVLRVKRPKNASKIAPASFNYINSGTEEMRFENGQFVPNGK